jgi:hypothetical protein
LRSIDLKSIEKQVPADVQRWTSPAPCAYLSSILSLYCLRTLAFRKGEALFIFTRSTTQLQQRRSQHVPVIDRIDYHWIQRFMEKNNIVARAQTGKLMVCAERMEHIEKEISYHLGVVAR